MINTLLKVEGLEYTNKRLRKRLDEAYADPGDLPVSGCGDNSCEVEKPKGMATNGGCRCDEGTLRRALHYYKRRCIFLTGSVQELKGQLTAVEEIFKHNEMRLAKFDEGE